MVRPLEFLDAFIAFIGDISDNWIFVDFGMGPVVTGDPVNLYQIAARDLMKAPHLLVWRVSNGIRGPFHTLFFRLQDYQFFQGNPRQMFCPGYRQRVRPPKPD
jgi:hypothetical protein